MNPIYRFELSGNDQTFLANPVWPESLAKDYERQSGQQFFRAKLSGKLTFKGDDYTFIVSQAFDTQFQINVLISYDMGQTWAVYWNGTFWKTDCEINEDDGTVVVIPSVLDKYNDILAGMEKEFNLIELTPEIAQIKADKRPMIQIYVPGESVIACFLSGMWWEQECDVVNENDTVEISGQSYPALTHKYHFAKNTTGRIVDISGNTYPALPPAFVLTNPPSSPYFSIDNGEYTFWAYRNDDNPGNEFDEWYITRNSDNVDLWYGRLYSSQQSTIPYTATLNPVEGTGATGTVTIDVRDINIYARYVLDVPTIGGNATYPLPYDDLVPNNRNYHRAIGYAVNNVIYFSTRFSNTPTQWGLYQPGKYYQQPYLYWLPEMFPISRNSWGAFSIWFSFSEMDWLLEEQGRAEFTLNDAYPLASVISVLLAKIAPGVTHEATTEYSEFLYGTNPITYLNQTLLITPKSNVMFSGYDQPAQKAPITLKNITDMLRDCFRCYWFIDDMNRFRIEHIRYFMNGESYVSAPVVGIDLTTISVPRNGKQWAFAQNKYAFDKPEMTGRYQFGWMDDVTQLFEGYPIDILANFVDKEKIEEITVNKFTSDVDYIMLNPSSISEDGFVLLAATASGSGYRLPYVNLGESRIQNGYVAFVILQEYYLYDLPAYRYEINGNAADAYGIKRQKTQTVNFPVNADPDLFKLIKTNLGNGSIRKLSVNLSSRKANATLEYDTE